MSLSPSNAAPRLYERAATIYDNTYKNTSAPRLYGRAATIYDNPNNNIHIPERAHGAHAYAHTHTCDVILELKYLLKRASTLFLKKKENFCPPALLAAG